MLYHFYYNCIVLCYYFGNLQTCHLHHRRFTHKRQHTVAAVKESNQAKTLFYNKNGVHNRHGECVGNFDKKLYKIFTKLRF